MAQLSAELAKETEEAEGGSFELLPVGVYHARLMEVDATKPPGPKGPYWSFQYDVVDPPEFAKRKLWDNVSLSSGSAYKRQQVWAALGFPLTTDTEDMLGTIIKVVVGHRVIQKGAREGEKTEQIDMTKPADPEIAAGCVAERDESQDLF